MIDNRASRAPMSPPETGASNAITPFANASSAIRTAKPGRLVVISTIALPGARPASAPSSPRITSSTSEGYPTIVKTTSLCNATSRGLEQADAPRLIRSFSFDGVRLNTEVLYPALRRCEHMLRPMTPVPIQPIRVDFGFAISIKNKVAFYFGERRLTAMKHTCARRAMWRVYRVRVRGRQSRGWSIVARRRLQSR